MPSPNGRTPHTRYKLLVAVTDSQSLLLLRGQLSAARRAGFDVSVMSAPGEIATRIAKAEGVTHIPVPMQRGMAPGEDLASLVRIVGVLRDLRPDVVNASTPKAGLLVTIAARLTGVPVRVHTLRGLRFETMTGGSRALLAWLTRLTCQLSHSVICISPSLRERAIELGVVDRARSTVLGAGSSNGLDEQRFTPSDSTRAAGRALRRDLGIASSSCVIGFVGRIAVDKGMCDLAEAWRVVRGTHDDIDLLVVGESDPTDAIPAGLEEALRADPRCHFTGMIDDVTTAYAAMDLVVLPTYREGFGNVLIEGAAMGLPTVATAVTGCMDAVADGVTGTLVPPRDSAALAGAIDAYIRDPELRRAHGRAGGERVRRLFDQQELWDRLHAEYLRLLMGARH